MQHHLKDLLFKDGVYDPEETVETFCHAEDRRSGNGGRPGSRCMRSVAYLTSRIRPFASSYCLAEGLRPAARRRSRLALTLAEREDISRGIASGSSIREIARRMNRAASTVSREVRRHGGRPAYRAHDADCQAWVSALRPKRCLLAMNRKLRDIVASKLILDWSPEQISGWLKIEYPNDERMRVSHETIYRSLFIQARGVLKKELMELPAIEAAHAPLAALSYRSKTRAVESSMPSRFGKDLRKWRTARFLVIGKAIC